MNWEERTMANIDEQIVDLVVEISGEDEVADERDIDLFEEEILDSMAAIELLVALKEEFGVSIAPTELDREEMNTVNKIIARVRERM
ncbi:MAG: D-alanine--poly(phosphoribitol) ligase subunit DltC [Atopobiaceae bacterium]|nr:D-alanine--poly(phosphoribitol) ligase subunit DltC [Atopobiaceae bacterium]